MGLKSGRTDYRDVPTSESEMYAQEGKREGEREG